MKRLDYFGFAGLILGMALGIYIGGFEGGSIFGTCLTSFVFAAIGKIIQYQTNKRIGKRSVN